MEFVWYDEEARQSWQRNRKTYWTLVILSPFVVLVSLFGLYALAGLGLILFLYGLRRLIWASKWDKKFDPACDGATLVVTGSKITVSRRGEVLFSCPIASFESFEFEELEPFSLRLCARDEPDVVVEVFPQETVGDTFWECLDALEAVVPVDTERTSLAFWQATPRHTASRAALLTVLGVLFLVAAVVLAMRTITPENLSGTDFATLVTMILSLVGLSCVASGIVVFVGARGRMPDTVPVPGSRVAGFETDYYRRASARGFCFVAAVMVLVGPAGFIGWPKNFVALLVGIAGLALLCYAWSMANVHGTVIAVSDQYLAVAKGRRVFQFRHGHYAIEPGYVLLGFRLPLPGPGVVVFQEQTFVCTSDRFGKDGQFLAVVKELSDNTRQIEEAQGT